MALFAPHMNSFRRLRPGNHAPSAVAWGYENRTAAIRIPGGNPKARRIEHRVAGADANPYLVLAAILGAALAGIEGRMIPADPIMGDAYGQRLPTIPPDWASAVYAFEHGPMIPQMLSPTLQRMLVDAGLGTAAALRAATFDAAKALRIDGETGSIERGKAADLVILEQNPFDDIKHVGSIRELMRGGVRYRPSELLTT